MAKKCKKCGKTYDDTWRVCLFCGSKLKSSEECKDVCETEGTTPLEEIEEKKDLLTLEGIIYKIVLILFITGVLALAYYFGSKFWTGVLEKFFWGSY